MALLDMQSYDPNRLEQLVLDLESEVHFLNFHSLISGNSAVRKLSVFYERIANEVLSYSKELEEIGKEIYFLSRQIRINSFSQETKENFLKLDRLTRIILYIASSALILPPISDKILAL